MTVHLGRHQSLQRPLLETRERRERRRVGLLEQLLERLCEQLWIQGQIRPAIQPATQVPTRVPTPVATQPNIHSDEQRDVLRETRRTLRRAVAGYERRTREITNPKHQTPNKPQCLNDPTLEPELRNQNLCILRNLRIIRALGAGCRESICSGQRRAVTQFPRRGCGLETALGVAFEQALKQALKCALNRAFD